jgi:hypothetical protein
MRPERVPAPLVQTSGLDEDPGFELLEQVISSEGRFTAAISERIRAAFRQYADGDGASSLEACLGWQARPGERSIATRLAEVKRLRALADAWRAMIGCDGLSDWRRCEILATEVLNFESVYLPAWEKGLPADASKLRRALYIAFTALERPPPKTAKGLHELLKRAGVLT